MAHHDYPVGWTSPVPAGYVPGELEYKLLWDQLVGSINGDVGGTWAPSAFITVGGAGFQFTGTGHTLADGGRIRLAGTGSGDAGKIDLKVTSGVASVEVNSSAVLRIKTGGQIDVQNNGDVFWDSGGTATFAGGSIINAAGTANFNSGSSTAVKSGATWAFQSGATVTLATTMSVTGQITIASGGVLTLSGSGGVLGGSGSTVTLQGTNNLSSLKLVGSTVWPELSTARSWTRSSLDVAWSTLDGGQELGSASENPDIWSETSDVSTGRILRTHPMNTTGAYSVVQFRDLPSGGTITNVKVKTKGGVADVTEYPKFRLIRWQDGENNYESLSSLVTDAHSGGGNFDTTIEETTITPSSTTVIDNAYNYGLLMLHPHWSGISNSMRVYNVKMAGTIDFIRAD